MNEVWTILEHLLILIMLISAFTNALLKSQVVFINIS